MAYFFRFVSIVNYIVMWDLAKEYLFLRSDFLEFVVVTQFIVSDYCIILSQISKGIFTSWEETSQLPVWTLLVSVGAPGRGWNVFVSLHGSND